MRRSESGIVSVTMRAGGLYRFGRLCDPVVCDKLATHTVGSCMAPAGELVTHYERLHLTRELRKTKFPCEQSPQQYDDLSAAHAGDFDCTGHGNCACNTGPAPPLKNRPMGSMVNVSSTENIEPLLKSHCFECHSHASGEMEGGLTLDSRSGWAEGGSRGPAIVPGKPEESLLIKALRSRGLRSPDAS